MAFATFVLWGGALAAGVSVTLIAYLVFGSILAMRPDDRAWRDPPPAVWRPIWGVVRWCEPAIGRFVSPDSAIRLAPALRRAGLEYSVRPTEFRAVQAVHAALATMLSAALAAALSSGDVPAAAHAGVALASLAGWIWPTLVLRDRIVRRRAALVRALPFCLDVIVLCVEAGLNLQGALAQAVAKGPAGPLRDELQRCLRDIRAGKPRADALTAMADRVAEPGLTQFVSAVVQAEALGMSLGPVLRAQADQRRSERFLHAEKLALQAPVKLLLPLIACIFPCTFIVLFFPIAMKLLQPGL